MGTGGQVLEKSHKKSSAEKRLELEVARLKKVVDVLSRSLKTKSEELEQKKQLINKMIEKNLHLPLSPPPAPAGAAAGEVSEATGDLVEDLDLDIDSLLQANLGAVNITDFLNLSGSYKNLPDLSVLEAELGQEKVS